MKTILKALTILVLVSTMRCFAIAQSTAEQTYDSVIPKAVQGPFISDPDVITELDCPKENQGKCNGKLSFNSMVGQLAKAHKKCNPERKVEASENAFTFCLSDRISKSIEVDLTKIRAKAGLPALGKSEDTQLSLKFLTDPGSKIELVGVVNRMDRQFLRDSGQGHSKEQLACGEVSLIYRFSYQLSAAQESRLPVTINLVLPALPSGHLEQGITCATLAQRWIQLVNSPIKSRSEVKKLFDTESGALAFINGIDIDRLELNMQAYRASAQRDWHKTDFGSKSEYLLRVYRWSVQDSKFLESFMGNQINRELILCGQNDNHSKCNQKRKLRKKLVSYLQRPEVAYSIDNGTLELPIDLGVLINRKGATSVSPGGVYRSGNQPYWNSGMSSQQVISDPEILIAMKNGRKAGKFILTGSVEDFRTRLNESTCTGCHQTRAIAGFHFPGADREGTFSANSILLPGSAHFYGDQPRRMKVLRAIASSDGQKLKARQLTVGYAARSNDEFKTALSSTELVDGWGAACIDGENGGKSKRNWTCRAGLECVRLFDTPNEKFVGTCVTRDSKALPKIGEYLQLGNVKTAKFSDDKYVRTWPDVPGEIGIDGRILDLPVLLKSNAPPNNSYYGAHQEFHKGKELSSSLSKEDRRDRATGGFLSGMLRLQECINLPDEASCGLIASSGFNDCLTAIRNGNTQRASIESCFSYFTSYAGLRSCNGAKPCRDDYICVQSVGYGDIATRDLKHKEREKRLNGSEFFRKISGFKYDKDYFGQKKPDLSWLNSNRGNGVCIPPYFVFQFRSDNHPVP